MNKKELTRKLMKQMQNFGYSPSFTNVKTFIQEYEKLTNSEPQKPVVPHFVAEWIEKVGGNLFGLNYDMVPEEIYDWVNEEKGNFKKLHLACAIGYEVEKEKRYKVKIKASGQYIMRDPDEDAIYFYSSKAYSKLTKKKLEQAGYGWIFSCEGIEVEEVE